MGETGPAGHGDARTGFDDHLRRALAAQADGWALEGADPATRRRVLADLRQRRRRRVTIASAVGAAGMFACVLVVAGLQTLSLSGRVVHGPAQGLASATPGCVQVQVGTAASACAGTFAATTATPPGFSSATRTPQAPAAASAGATGSGTAAGTATAGTATPRTATAGTASSGAAANGPAANVASQSPDEVPATTAGRAAAGTAASLPPAVSARVGQRVTVTLPEGVAVRWTPPTPATPSAFALAPGTPSTGQGGIRTRTHETRGGAVSATFTALRPGTVTVTATGTCPTDAGATAPAKPTPGSDGAAARACRSGSVQWSVVLRISR